MYIKIKDIKAIERQRTNYVLVVDDKTNKLGERLYRINEDALNIIKNLNGSKTLTEISIILSEENNCSVKESKNIIVNFMKSIENSLGIEIEETNIYNPIETPILGTGKFQYPSAISLEVTHKCNAKCLHCYGEYCPSINLDHNTEEMKKVLKDSRLAGTRVVELTGGEVTCHPDFYEILKYTYELDYSLVSILSNGLYWDEKLLNLIKTNKDRTVVQIDLHGNNDNYLNWFMGTSIHEITERIKNTIKKIHSFGIFMRVVTMVTPKNIDQLESIADWLSDIGIESYGLSVITPMGRADNEDKNGLLLETEEDGQNFGNAIKKIYEKHGEGFLYEEKDGDSTQKNCGAFTSNPSITPKGDIKFCAMDSEDIIKSIGNVFENDIRDIFTDNFELMNTIRNIQAPNFESNECKSCDKKFFCGSCIIRGLASAKEIGYENCLWYKNNIPDEFRSLII